MQLIFFHWDYNIALLLFSMLITGVERTLKESNFYKL